MIILKILDYSDTMLYTLSMRRGKRYIGRIDGTRYWKGIICGHPVPMYQTKRCSSCFHKYLAELLKGRAKSPESIAKRTGRRNWNWKGGKVLHKPSGYILIKNRNHPNVQKNGYIFEHRIVMEK